MEGRDVAVVILNWNGAELLSRFLPSVVEHTPAWVDIYIADNGSTDGSLATIEGRVKTIQLDRNYGFAGGYNLALAQLKHHYFILLNSDVEVTAGWCEPLIERLEGGVGAVAPKILSAVDRSRFDYAGAAGGMIDYLGYPYCRGRILSRVERDRGQYDGGGDIFWASGAAFGCRSELFHSLGGFDSDFFAHQEEIDLCWRMQLAGYRVVVEPRSVVYHLGGATLESGSAKKIYLNHRNNLIMLVKCASWGQLIAVALLRPSLDIMAAISYLLKGRADQFAAVFRAWGSTIRMLPSSLKKRSSICREAKPRGIYRGSLFWLAWQGSKGKDMPCNSYCNEDKK
ncbi:MAG: glycosyltransferase family 2 protein [Rikenellaceae bacterium]